MGPRHHGGEEPYPVTAVTFRVHSIVYAEELRVQMEEEGTRDKLTARCGPRVPP